MNTSGEVQQREMRRRAPNLEPLDARIVPAAMQPVAAAAVQTGEAMTDAARGIVRHEIRAERLIRQHDLQVARLEAREARFAARHHLDATATAVPAAAVASNFQQVTGASATRASRPAGSLPGTVSPTAPVSVDPPSSNSPPVTTPTPVNPTTPVTTTGPLPANVASALDTIYDEYESGTLPTSNGPGQIEIQGNNVGVTIKVTNPSDFATVSAEAQGLGLQVTGDSPSTDTIAGWLPISELPAVAQLADAPIIAPIYGPVAR